MPRSARILPSEGMLHLIGRANNKEKLFRHRVDFLRFKNTLHRFLHKDQCAIQHYAFMHTHFHLLAWVARTERLAALMKAVMVSYQYYYSRRYSYKGHLWHSRYRSIIISDDSQWLQCARYIELNPVYAGICKDPKEYCWTSYRHHAYGAYDPLIYEVFTVPGESKWRRGRQNSAYQEFVRAGIDLDYRRLKREFEQKRYDVDKAKVPKIEKLKK
ncbi:MAG: transposase [Pseudomonadota bacterium]